MLRLILSPGRPSSLAGWVCSANGGRHCAELHSHSSFQAPASSSSSTHSHRFSSEPLRDTLPLERDERQARASSKRRESISATSTAESAPIRSEEEIQTSSGESSRRPKRSIPRSSHPAKKQLFAESKPWEAIDRPAAGGSKRSGKAPKSANVVSPVRDRNRKEHHPSTSPRPLTNKGVAARIRAEKTVEMGVIATSSANSPTLSNHSPALASVVETSTQSIPIKDGPPQVALVKSVQSDGKAHPIKPASKLPAKPLSRISKDSKRVSIIATQKAALTKVTAKRPVAKGEVVGTVDRTRQPVKVKRANVPADLPLYDVLRPAGAIDAMRKDAETIAAESHPQPAQLKENDSCYGAISTHRSPQVHIYDAESEMNKRLKAIKARDILSFDMEWPPYGDGDGKVAKTSVIQLASASDVYVLQVGKMQTLPQELVRILCDPTIIKCGVSIGTDASKLKKDFPFEQPLQNLVELGRVAREADAARWRSAPNLIGLDTLCRTYLGRRLDKKSYVRRSAWDAANLSEKQLQYAATDAYAGLEILHRLVNHYIPRRGDQFQLSEVQQVMRKADCVPPHEQSKSIVPNALLRFVDLIQGVYPESVKGDGKKPMVPNRTEQEKRQFL